ncbi:MAG: hypothetical protein FD155_2449 [Bacteroidetes bacterium]|nr:MAG: hypothetical protein FD155_2449 [Bacteroidota bacterium]
MISNSLPGCFQTRFLHLSLLFEIFIESKLLSMKKVFLKLSLSLLLTVFVGSQLMAQRAEFKFDTRSSSEGFTILRSESNALHFAHALPFMAIDDFSDNGYSGKNIELGGIYLPANAGDPNLPANSRLIAKPNGAKATLRILNVKKEVISNIDLLPAASIPLSNDDRPSEYIKNEAIYSKDGFFPAEPFQLSKEVTLIRGVETVMLGITPFQYNPVTKELIVYYDIEAEVVFEGGDGSFGEDRLRNPWWDNILNDNILNNSVLPQVDYSARTRKIADSKDEGCEYLIIIPTGAAFAQWADTIRVFRQHQGINTKIVTITEVGGNTVAAMEAYVNNAYNNWNPAPAAILLLGDYSTNAADGIISHTLNDHPGGYNPYISDNPFSDVTGDKLPDISFARITARNAAELEHMIGKFLDYERTPPTSADFYDHPITAMGWQTERWFQICSETVNGFWQHGLGKNPVRENAIYSGTPGGAWSSNANTATVVNYFGPNGLNYIPANTAHLTDWGGNATRVNASINNGAFMLQHRDHGFEGGWGEPDYTTTHLPGLTNEDLTFVLSINCLTGKFNHSSECFTEKFHRHAHGALGLLAATEVSYSFVNDVFVWGAFDNMWPQFMPAFGSNPAPRGILPAFANTAGKYFLQQSNWPYNPEHKNITYNLFHHHGDAFMTVYSEVPQQLAVNHMPILLSGMETFEVTANEGAMIALTVNDEIIGFGIAGNGPTIIPIAMQLPGVSVRVTVTLQNYYRYENVIECIPPSGPYIIYSAYTIDDASGNGNGMAEYGESINLDVAVKNVGSEIAENVTVTASSTSPYLSFTTSSFTVGNVDPGAIAITSAALQFIVANNVPNNENLVIQLTVYSGSNEWTSQFSVPAYAPDFTIGAFSISDPQGNGNGRLDPGESVEMTFTAVNNGQSAAFYGTGLLVINSPFITITNASTPFAQINAGETVAATYTAVVSGGAPVGSLANFTYSLSAGAYSDSKNFSAKIGLVLEDFETGNFSAFPWTNGGNQPWQITNVEPFAGVYSAKSGTISSNQSTQMILQYEVGTSDTISFYFKVSSESNYDFLRFYIGSTKMGEWSGTVNWTKASYPVGTGLKTFKWEYMKDGSVNSGTDCAWIDDVVFPAMATTSAWAGNDMAICEGNTAQLNATVSNYTSLLWTTSGTGTFSNTGIANPIYTPSEADYLAGNVLLTITATGTTVVSDICTLSFNPAATAYAGLGQTICPSEAYTIADASAENYTSLAWVSSGDGTFDDVTLLHPVYTPGINDVTTGTVELTLTASAMTGCSSTSSFQTLTIYPEPAVELGENRWVCAGGNNVLIDNALATNYGSLSWTSNGSGTFTDPASLVTTYQPSTQDESLGSITLYLMASSQGECLAASDSILLTINVLPTVQMSGDQTICQGTEASFEINLTGQAPWLLTMAEPMPAVAIEVSPYVMPMSPESSTQLIATQISDANCAASIDAHMWIHVLTQPVQPTSPAGADTVDFNDGFTSVYTLQTVSNEESLTVSLSPENAGAVEINGTEAVVTWNVDFRGQAELKVQATNLCGMSEWSLAKEIEVKSTIGLNEQEASMVRIYPNPATRMCTIEIKGFANDDLSLKVTDITGKVVYSEDFTISDTHLKQLSVDHFSKGIYFIQVSDGIKTVHHKLIHQ